MYAAVTHVKLKPNSKKEVGEMAMSMEVPDIRSIPGFVAYYVINEEGDNYTTISVFEDPSGWRKWKDMFRNASKDKDFRKHLLGGPEGVRATAGHVVFSRTAR
jgi:heme-degrading monooxygenase HmoA